VVPKLPLFGESSEDGCVKGYLIDGIYYHVWQAGMSGLWQSRLELHVGWYSGYGCRREGLGSDVPITSHLLHPYLKNFFVLIRSKEAVNNIFLSTIYTYDNFHNACRT